MNQKDGKTAPSLLTLRDVERLTGLAATTLRSARWRRSAGLRVTKIGRRVVGVAPEDLAAALRREALPTDDHDGGGEAA
jgi:hypothetical protein